MSSVFTRFSNCRYSLKGEGQQAMEQLSEQLACLSEGEGPEVEALNEQLAQMTLAIGTDGVKVPFRPIARTPKGKTRWREVKIAVLAGLEQTLNSVGERITRLRWQRLVGVLGVSRRSVPDCNWKPCAKG